MAEEQVARRRDAQKSRVALERTTTDSLIFRFPVDFIEQFVS